MAEHKDPRVNRDEPLHQAFDRMAEDLNLRLETAEGPVLPGGFVCGGIVRHNILVAPPIVAQDDRQIRNIIRAWESLSTAVFLESWQQYAYDPYIGVDCEGLIKVDQKILKKWLSSRGYARHQKCYPPCSPRKVKVSKIRIVYIARCHACATYRVTETFSNGKVLASNLATIFAKLDNIGWRIVVATKHGWEEQTPRASEP